MCEHVIRFFLVYGYFFGIFDDVVFQKLAFYSTESRENVFFLFFFQSLPLMVTLGQGIFCGVNCFLFLKLWPETFFVGDICPNLDVTFYQKV